MTALSFDTTSPANPDEYRHKTYIARNHRLWGYIFAADSIYASACNLKQPCLKRVHTTIPTTTIPTTAIPTTVVAVHFRSLRGIK